ncbi:amidohydrolase [Escherichia coli]|nr:amidohydrolase [Escherichia coli]
MMTTGTNFLNEHIIEKARVHYAITDSGGISPNVVRAQAEVLYLIRAPK